MTQQSGNQFDDDLTVGMDDEGSFSTDSIDLFEFTGDEESPIARLKTIILSIDWEINDDILQQLDDELVDLGDIWAGDKIKQIYIQGLNKIGKYIYKEKANAHPNAIKLLITFYHNLERIVSSDGLMSEEEKKQLLLEDVKKFDQLKSQIGKSEPATKTVTVSAAPAGDTDQTEQLKVLKALVLGLDWEINDKELGKLGEEVQRLEGVFSQSKAKCILLQGIGALSSYIKKMRSNSNSKAFSLLHSFYDVLQKITLAEASADEEQQLLLSEVEKFNAFKREIAQEQSEAEVESEPTSAKVAAVTDVPAESLPVDEDVDETQVASDVDSRLASVFGNISEQEEDEIADESMALEGVNVETEADDDSDEEALPYEGDSVAPALAEVEEESSFSVEKLAGDLAQSIEAEDSEGVEAETESVPVGVDVETVADDDSDEESLPFQDGEVAPALTGSSDEGGFDEESLTADFDDSASDDLDNRLDTFFDDEVQTSSDEWGGTQGEASEQETEDEEQDLMAALSDVAEDEHGPAEEVSEEAVAEKLSFFDDEEPAPEGDEPFVDEDVTEEESSEDIAFASEDEPVPALSDEEEAPVSEDVIEEAVAEKLSFFDDEEAAPEGDEPFVDEDVIEEESSEDIAFASEDEPVPALSDEEEAPVSEDVIEEAVAEKLSFFDDEEPAPEGDEPFVDEDVIEEESSEDIAFASEDEPVPALSDKEEVSVSEDVIEEAVAEKLSFFDDEEPAPEGDEPFVDEDVTEEESSEDIAFASEDEPVPALSDEEEVSVSEDVIEEAVAEKLSFFDDEEPAPEGDEPFVDEEVIEEESSEDIAFASEDEPVPSLSDEEEVPVSEDVVEEAVAEKLSFFDDEEPEEGGELEGALFDETEELAVAEESDDEEALSFLDEEAESLVIEEPAGSADSEELFDNDEIEFTVPGEITPGVESDVIDEKASSLEDVIDFQVPGEADTTETILAAIDDTDGDEVVFEAVDDDVEVDLLPGEEYADSEDEDSEVAVPSGDEEEVLFLEEKAPEAPSVEESVVVSSDEYVTLHNLIGSVQEGVTADGLQDLLSEINRLRSSSTYSYTAKIFLQLLSTVCQHTEGTLDDSGDVNLSLMEEVYSGLKMNASSGVASEQVQKHLLACTSQVLLLQQKDINRAQTVLSAGQQEAALVEDGDSTDDESAIEEVVSEESSEGGEDLKTQVKEELADIKKLFLDEITALRKKFVDK